MCNFHSICGRMLGDVAELLHDPSNSHSGMMSTAKWRENKPNEPIRVFEAEWNGKGAFPPDGKLIRNIADCPEKLKDKIRNHFKKLQAFLKGDIKAFPHFMDGEKYSDIWSRLTSLPDNVKFPDTLNGDLYLRSDLHKIYEARKKK